jgi:hypothetical protein
MGSAEFDHEVRPRALTVTMVTLGSNIPPRPSLNMIKQGSTSPPPTMPEAAPVLPEETNPLPRRRVYQDFELDMQAVPLLPPELDETLVLPADEQGKMQLLLLVSATGEVLWAYVEATELSPETSEMLAERFRQTRFDPGTVNQRAVDSLYRIEVSLAAAIPLP